MTQFRTKRECATPELMARYYGGLLDDEEAGDLEAHIFGCELCRALADQMEEAALETLNMEPELAAAAPPLGFLEGVRVAEALRSRIEQWMLSGSELAANVHFTARTISYSIADALVRPQPLLDLAAAQAGGLGRSTSAQPLRGQMQGASLDIPGVGDLAARVTVDLRNKKLRVDIGSMPEQFRDPMVAFRPKLDGEVEVRAMRRLPPMSEEPGVVDCQAEFDLAESEWNGDGLVVIEPLQ